MTNTTKPCADIRGLAEAIVQHADPAKLDKALSADPEPCVPHDTLLDLLPHGSGIDYDWQFETLKNGAVLCYNAFHGMAECGMYDGIQDFTVKIYRHKDSKVRRLNDGRIQVHWVKGDVDLTLVLNAPRLNRSWTYGLQDYLYETVCYCLTESDLPTPQHLCYYPDDLGPDPLVAVLRMLEKAVTNADPNDESYSDPLFKDLRTLRDLATQIHLSYHPTIDCPSLKAHRIF